VGWSSCTFREAVTLFSHAVDPQTTFSVEAGV
jgi:hypothetical protein